MPEPDHYKILGIGTPVIDQTILISEAFLKTISGIPGGTEIVDYETYANIFKQSRKTPISTAGGSTINTIKGLARLGHSCKIFGKIGSDAAGDQFQLSIESFGIEADLISVNKPTAQAACLITPDKNRTMRSFLGAGVDLKPEDLNPKLFKGIQWVHIEGYLFACEGVIERAMELAKNEGAQISFDLSSFEIVSQHKSEIADFLSNYVNIVFANEEESFTLTKAMPEHSCQILRDLAEVAVVKMGGLGGWAANAKENIYYPAVPAKVVDTTGAGDLFASGFLHAHLQKRKLADCAQLGAMIASEAIQVIGTDISLQKWEEIKKAYD